MERINVSLAGRILDILWRVMAGAVVLFCFLVIGMALLSVIIPEAGVANSLDVISAKVFMLENVWIAAMAVVCAAGHFLRKRSVGG